MITRRSRSRTPSALSSTRHLGGIPTQRTSRHTTVAVDSGYFLSSRVPVHRCSICRLHSSTSLGDASVVYTFEVSGLSVFLTRIPVTDYSRVISCISFVESPRR